MGFPCCFTHCVGSMSGVPVFYGIIHFLFDSFLICEVLFLLRSSGGHKKAIHGLALNANALAPVNKKP